MLTINIDINNKNNSRTNQEKTRRKKGQNPRRTSPRPQEGVAEKGKLGQFEVFGLDVIVDADQRVYLLEPYRGRGLGGWVAAG